MPGPHDALCKLAFRNLDHACGLLRSMVPSALEKLIDWQTLTLDSETLVGPDLSEHTTDLLYRVRLGGRNAFIYVLLEHRSTVSSVMHLRLLDNMVRIWWRHQEKEGASTPLPAILPVVLHHSERGWSAPTDFSAMLDLDADALGVLRPYLPLFRFVLDDISKATDVAIRGREGPTPFGRVALVALRHGRSEPQLLAAVARWSDVVGEILRRPGGGYAFSLIVGYAYRVAKRPPAAVLRDLKTALRGAVEEDVLATAWDQLMDDGGARELRKVLPRLVQARFGGLDDDLRSRIETADLPTLERWVERFATAATLADVFEK